MMLKNNLVRVFVLGLSILLTQCGQEDLTVLLNQSGQLSVTILDSAGVGVTDLEVILSNQTAGMLDIKTTNENGLIDFGALQAGNYSVQFKTTIGNKYYEIRQAVQVVSAATVTKEITVSDYEEELKISTINSANSERLQMAGLQIAIIPINDAYYEAFTTAERLALAIVNEATDATGSVNVTVPLGSYVTYLLSGEEIVASNSFLVEFGSTEYVYFYVSPLEMALKNAKTWQITGITTQELIPVDVDLDYLSLSFNTDIDHALLTRRDNENLLSDNYYVNYNTNGSTGFDGVLQIYFNTPSYEQIEGDITLTESGALVWRCYDSNYGGYLIITMQ